MTIILLLTEDDNFVDRLEYDYFVDRVWTIILLSTEDGSNGLWLSTREDGALWFRVVQRGAEPDIEESVLALGVLRENQWHHVATTYDYSTGLAKLYVDGAMAGQLGEWEQ